jgi:phage gpG-like protein
MAGVVAVMSIKDAQVYARNMAQPGSYLRPLKITTQIMVSGIRKGFSGQASPSGDPWHPLSPLTLSLRRKGKSADSAKILRDREALLASTTGGAGPGAVRRISDTESVVGTNLIYAATHQFGRLATVTPKARRYLHWRGVHLRKSTMTLMIPARPFVGHRPENIPRYEAVFSEHEERRAAGDGKSPT